MRNLQVLSLTMTLSLASTAVQASADQAPALDVSPIRATRLGSALPSGWARSGAFMQIFVRSYKDSNGDGIGDLNGLTSKLDYLQSLGITGIWLMPIMSSTDHVHGYAVHDYRAIEPAFGTLEDFDNLIKEAHKRKIGVILDYVVNHSGSDNPIFISAAQSATSPYRDWYLFSKQDPKWKNKGWHTAKQANGNIEYYYSFFGEIAPDWNLKNPRVVRYHAGNLRFWLNRGVDGFRFDAVSMLVEKRP